MDDKIIMSTILSNAKSACDLMLHGSLESSTPEVHSAFCSALTDAVAMQNKIYAKMTQKGWYQTQPVEKTKIDSTLQKFASQSQQG